MRARAVEVVDGALVPGFIPISCPSRTPKSETKEACGDGGISVLLLLTLDMELLFKLVRLELANVEVLR